MKGLSGISLADLDAYLDNALDTTQKKSFPLSMYYSEGVKFHHHRQYGIALKNYEAALRIEPNSVQTLLKRSKAYIELQEYSKARKDAMAAIKLVSSSSFSRAHDLKGKCEYFMGDFERGFLTYFRGRQTSPGSDKLRLGQQLCEEAMMNALLKKSEKKIDDRDIKLLLNKRGDYGSGLKIRSRYPDDLKTMEELLSDGDMKYVHGICQDVLKFIKSSDKFWRMQNPLHSRNKEPLQRRQIPKKTSLIKHVISVVRRCHYYLRKELSRQCISECQKLMQFIESHPELELDTSAEYKADMFHLLGLAYEMQMEEKLSLNCFEEELKVAQAYGLVQQEIRALHNLGVRYLRKGRLDKACRCSLGITEALNSKSAKNLLNATQSVDVNRGVTIEKDAKLGEVQSAIVWARNFKSKISSAIQDAIISPAEYLLLDIYEKEMWSMNADIILRDLYDSEEDDIENCLKLNYSKEENSTS